MISSSAIMSPTGQATHEQPRLIGAAYYVDYDVHAWDSLLIYGRRLHTVITTSHVIADRTGRLEGRSEPRVLQLARERGTNVLLRVGNEARGRFSRTIARAVLTAPEARSALLGDIADVLDRDGYDGVNVRLENVAPQDRAAFVALVRELTSRLRPRGKMVAITVPGKTDDLPEDDRHGAFDLAALGSACDWIIVMPYDGPERRGDPRPVASLPWVEAVVRYTAGVVPRERVLLDVPFYGYDWAAHGEPEAISMREAMARAGHAGASLEWDEPAQVPYFTAAERRVYFENARSVERKAAVAARYGLAGIAAWRLGQELPDVWSTLDAYLRPASGPTR